MHFTRHDLDETPDRELLFLLIELLGEMMSALDNLNTAVAANTTAVSDAINKINADSPDPAIQAAADQINENNTNLEAAVNPAPAPVPTEPAATSVSTPDSPTPVEPGYTTTEFWVTILTVVGAVFTALFHKSLPVDVPQFSVAASGVAAGLYSISRAVVKKG